MRHFLATCLCLLSLKSLAQPVTDSTTNVFYAHKLVNAIFHMSNDTEITGQILRITDSVVMIHEANGTDTDLYIKEIVTIKMKRKEVGARVASGAVVTGLVGYGLGYISYSDDTSQSDEDNNDNRKERAAIGALIGAVPGAFVGLVSSVFVRKKFRIDGQTDRMAAVKKVLR